MLIEPTSSARYDWNDGVWTISNPPVLEREYDERVRKWGRVQPNRGASPPKGWNVVDDDRYEEPRSSSHPRRAVETMLRLRLRCLWTAIGTTYSASCTDFPRVIGSSVRLSDPQPRCLMRFAVHQFRWDRRTGRGRHIGTVFRTRRPRHDPF
ncbi:hypothetical protein D8S78_01785 [Natrialba swarupiae]|nr:hypothetical protein [Natrialba swarupiae]